MDLCLIIIDFWISSILAMLLNWHNWNINDNEHAAAAAAADDDDDENDDDNCGVTRTVKTVLTGMTPGQGCLVCQGVDHSTVLLF